MTAALAQSDAEPRGSESSAWAAFWISEAARGHKYEELQVGFHAGWLAALAQSDAEPHGIWRHSAESAASDNASLRKAGIALAEAALRVIREYDGTHRLALAVADWSKVVANEGGRALVQSGARLVAWRVNFGDGWILCHSLKEAEREAESAGNLIQPLYTTTPRPDASAGLIEAAEIAEALAETGPDYEGASPSYYNGFSEGAEAVAKALRARAADRSGK